MAGHRKAPEAVWEAGAAHAEVHARCLRIGFALSGGRAALERRPSTGPAASSSIHHAVQGITILKRHSVCSGASLPGPRCNQPHPVRMRTLVGRRRAYRSRDRPAAFWAIQSASTHAQKGEWAMR